MKKLKAATINQLLNPGYKMEGLIAILMIVLGVVFIRYYHYRGYFGGKHSHKAIEEKLKKLEGK